MSDRAARLRILLVALTLAATAAFVVGVVLERNSGGERRPAAVEAAGHHDEAAGHGESGEHAAAEAGAPDAHGGASETHEQGEELRPLGIDVEAAPFVALAAAVSVLLALAAWLRPRPALLALVAVALLAFAALDVRELVHQLDEQRTGLALLAALVAALHAAGAAVAVLLARAASGEPAGGAGAIPA